MLECLYGIGALNVCKWYGHWALVRTAVPIGCERKVEYVEDEAELVVFNIGGNDEISG
jgi:hypothetical protein